MGRPLKIAKAQALLTITDTSAADVVTIAEDFTDPLSDAYGVTIGMPFIVTTSTGNLVAGTTYWILEITGASTFTVSAVELSDNPTFRQVDLSATTGTTIAMTVGLVDAGFQNPDTVQQSGNTTTNAGAPYGVVGGNTGFYGKQILAQVAIGINGTGTLSGISTSNAYVFGTGTDFANLTTGVALQVAVANNNGTTDYTNIGFSSATHGEISVAVANTKSTGNIIRTTGTATDLVVNQPVTFDGDIGNLVTGTTYYVLNVANASAFTVSTTRGGAEVDLSDETATPNALQQRLILAANPSITFTDAAYVYANDEAGYIVRQKGKTKYLVTGSTTNLTAQCYTANVANAALTPNTMSIIGTTAAPASVYVQSVNDYESRVFATTVAAGALSAGTDYVIYTTGTTDWTAVGAAGNLTGTTFTATAAGSGTGTAVLTSANPDIIATFDTAYAANTYGGQPNPIVVITNS